MTQDAPLNPSLSAPRKAWRVFCAGVAWGFCVSAAWACNTAAECNVKGQFHRADALYLRSTYPNNASNSRGTSSSGSGSALSSALANSFQRWEASRNAESDAVEARYRALDREARNKPVARFSEADIANDRRNVLIFGAEEGRALRQNQLGVALLSGGMGFVADPQKGLYWLRKAAAQGDHDALSNLAEVLTDGEYGVAADPVTGMQMHALFIGSSGLSPTDQTAYLLNKWIGVFKRNDRYYPQLIDAALKAHGQGVAHASQVIYKLILVAPPSPADARIQALLSTPNGDPYLLATRAFATAAGLLGVAKDPAQGLALLKAEVDLGHQPAIDVQLLLQCLQNAQTTDQRKACEPLVTPFYL
jgi:TPR repeat protein